MNLKKIEEMIKYYLFPALFLVIMACSNNRSSDMNLNDSQVSIDLQKEEVKNTLNKMWEAIEKEDIKLYASFIHPDFTQFGENDSILTIGKDAEVSGIKAWLENSSDIHTEMIDPIVTINGNVAWIVYYWSDNGLTNGDQFESKGKSTRIFVKENGKWLCIHGHYTLLPQKLVL